jgi:adenine-specific DNA-methyltransferase
MIVKNTETIGLWVEYLLCKIHNVPFKSSRTYIKELDYNISGFINKLTEITKELKIVEHIGQNNNNHDFLLADNKTLSVKTTISNYKVCPQEVGQTTLSKLNFKDKISYKKWVLTNPKEAFDFYSGGLFSSTYTIYVNFKKGEVFIIPAQKINSELFSFSFTKNIDTWVESCSMKIGNKTVAEFQVHNNRNCVKCRFSMNNISNLFDFKKLLFTKTDFKVAKSIGTFNYIGSKTKLLQFIEISIKDYIGKPIEKITSFYDIFSGTGVVSSHFMKLGCKNVITNDLMYYSYILTSCLTNKNINTKKIKDFVKELNETEPLEGYIYKTYASSRKYFTNNNAMLIDSIRTKIEENRENFTIEEYNILIKILLYSSTKVANISSTYGAYLKKYKKTALVKLKLNSNLLNDLYDCESVSYNKNVLDLQITGDVCYLDPPYNSRKYSSNYFVMESIAKYDKQEVSSGITGIPLKEPIGSSSFTSKKEVTNSFNTLLSKINTKYVFISYNSESLLSKQEMIDILLANSFKNVKVYSQEYKRFKSNKLVDNQLVNLEEYLFSAESI